MRYNYRSKHVRLTNGKKLYQDMPDQILSRFDCEDILMSSRIGNYSLQRCMRKVLTNIPHTYEGKDLVVSCKDFVMELMRLQKEYFLKDVPSVKVLVPVTEHVQTPPAVKESTSLLPSLPLSAEAKSFFIRIAKKKDMTVPQVLTRILEDFADERVKKAQEYAKLHAIDLAIDEIVF